MIDPFEENDYERPPNYGGERNEDYLRFGFEFNHSDGEKEHIKRTISGRPIEVSNLMTILGIPDDIRLTEENLKKYYRIACKKYHPDTPTGSHMLMVQVNRSFEMLKAYIEE